MLATQLQMKEQELIYLKKQIHPHFLFNTINTIYGFALNKSPRTPDIILKLSNLLDYILYQVDKPMVPLSEEVMHIREYIELEEIRFRDTLQVSFQVTPIDDSIQVAPMLLIPLVENAFKHGGLHDGRMTVHIHIEVTENSLKFFIENSILTAVQKSPENGIGLVNLRKRLDLIYRESYSLVCGPVNGNYQAELNITQLNIIHEEKTD
jgi:LytS/YehU family sensor histidine kinase